jgi:hypothetical protein
MRWPGKRAHKRNEGQVDAECRRRNLVAIPSIAFKWIQTEKDQKKSIWCAFIS